MAKPTLPSLNLHLQQLAYLVAVEDEGTLRQAAARLHVSQPALSQSLTELERRLGVVLFERSGRARKLTAEGQELVDFARRVLGDAESVAARLISGRDGQAGPLRVGMIDAASLYVLPETIRQYRGEYPAVELRLEVAASGVLLTRLAELALDLVFVTGPVEEADLVTTLIHEEPLYLYAPPGNRRPVEELDWVLYRRGVRPDAALIAH